MNPRALPMVALSLVLVGCEVPADPGRLGTSEQPIINGQVSQASFLPGVGALVAVQGTYQAAFCTGSLVGKDLVLTAAHCLASIPAGTKIGFYNGLKATGTLSSATILASSYKMHPSYKNQDPPGALADYYDIGVVKLSKASTATLVTLVRPKEVGTLLANGSPVLILGYGQTNPAVPSSSGTKMQGFSSLLQVGSSELYIKDPQLAQKCHGDSGGPTLMDAQAGSGAAWHLVGVASRAGQGCTYGSIETRVDVYLSWIHAQGTIPCGSGLSADCPTTPKPDSSLPKPPDLSPPVKKSLGQPCGGPDECKSALCIADGGAALCSQYCTVSKQDCPDGYLCKPINGSTKGACVKGQKPAPDSMPPEKKELGDSCAKNDECKSGMCGSSDGVSFCTRLCDPTQGCETGMECVDAGNGQFACMPEAVDNLANPEATSACTAASVPLSAGSLALAWPALLLLLLARRRRR